MAGAVSVAAIGKDSLSFSEAPVRNVILRGLFPFALCATLPGFPAWANPPNHWAAWSSQRPKQILLQANTNLNENVNRANPALLLIGLPAAVCRFSVSFLNAAPKFPTGCFRLRAGNFDVERLRLDNVLARETLNVLSATPSPCRLEQRHGGSRASPPISTRPYPARALLRRSRLASTSGLPVVPAKLQSAPAVRFLSASNAALRNGTTAVCNVAGRSSTRVRHQRGAQAVGRL